MRGPTRQGLAIDFFGNRGLLQGMVNRYGWLWRRDSGDFSPGTHIAGPSGWGLIAPACCDRAPRSAAFRACKGWLKTANTLRYVTECVHSAHHQVCLPGTVSAARPGARHTVVPCLLALTWRPDARPSRPREHPCPSSRQQQSRYTICL